MLPESAESILFRCGRKARARTSARRAAFSALVAGPGLPIFASSDGSPSRTPRNAPHRRYSRVVIIDIALGLRAAVSLLFDWSDRCRPSTVPPPCCELRRALEAQPPPQCIPYSPRRGYPSTAREPGLPEADGELGPTFASSGSCSDGIL